MNNTINSRGGVLTTDDIINNLNSNSTTQPLSAAQGAVLRANDDANYSSIQKIINGTTNVGNAVKWSGYTANMGQHCSSNTANIVCEYYGSCQYLTASDVVKGAITQCDGGKSAYELRDTGFYHINGALTDGPNIECSYCNVLVLRGADVLTQIVFPFNNSALLAIRNSYGIGTTNEVWGAWRNYQSCTYNLVGHDLYMYI